MNDVCTAAECGQRRHGRQPYCKVHYSRLRRTGRLEKSAPGSPSRPEAERFWPKVDKSGECWIWTANTNADGYGRFGPFLAHRVSYRLAFGDFSDDVDHRCRNPRCVRPDHLRLVTPSQNSQNVGAHRDSKTGIRGVFWEKRRRKYRVTAMVNGVRYDGGFFESLADAEDAAMRLRNTVMTHNDSDRMAVA